MGHQQEQLADPAPRISRRLQCLLDAVPERPEGTADAYSACHKLLLSSRGEELARDGPIMPSALGRPSPVIRSFSSPGVERGITGSAAVKAQVTDNRDGIVLDLAVFGGNPPDAPLLVPAIERVTALFGRAPRAVTADRGYGEARVESGLAQLDVQHVAIPRKGRPGPARRTLESSRRFRSLIKWRTGSEGASRTSSAPGASSARSSTARAGRRRGAGGECSLTTAPRSPRSSRRRTPSGLTLNSSGPNRRAPARRPGDRRQLPVMRDRSSSLSASPAAPRHRRW